MAHTEIEKPIDPKVKFTNPYNGPDVPVQQVVADVGVVDYNLVKGIRIRNGTITGVICILWKKLADECRARGITDFNSVSDFEKLVVDSKLVPIEELDMMKEQAAEGSIAKVKAASKKKIVQ